jgi:hypothetical protein
MKSTEMDIIGLSILAILACCDGLNWLMIYMAGSSRATHRSMRLKFGAVMHRKARASMVSTLYLLQDLETGTLRGRF